MDPLALDDFRKWLDTYGTAWEEGDAAVATELFSEGARYHETPFEEPMIGKQAIHRYWKEGAGDSQKNVHFAYESIAVSENKGLAQWRASFVRLPSGNHVELDGFLSAEFDSCGKCSVFREWWHRREHTGGSAQ
ncbi:MAG: nuclear transport factor 2 family protein [Anaerolineales bacterium]|jgi:hypothetical protein